MKLLCFALCVTLFVPGLVPAGDDGAGPSQQPTPLSRSDRIDEILGRIVDCQQKLNNAKEKKAKALEVLNTHEPRSKAGDQPSINY